MESEYFKVFDDDYNEIGVASREDVHRLGLWHETFHCWFVTKEKETDYLYLQLRSDRKKDYPNLLDITAAGHLTADEKVQDGVREIREEIGIDASFDDLIPLGTIDYCVKEKDFIDKEIAHVFLYKCAYTLDDFVLQEEEVSGMVMVEFNDFCELWLGQRETVRIKGFEINKDGNRMMVDGDVGRNKFVPHQNSFYEAVIQKIKEQM